MKVVHINMYDKGGAFQATYRLHQELLKNNIDSKNLVLYQYNSNLQEVYPFLSESSLFSKIEQSIKYRKNQNQIKKLLPVTPQYEFRFDFSPYNIEKHSIIKEADIIHLHWMAKFIDYSSFFKNIQKPVVWTLHDMLPIKGGFHYETYVDNRLLECETQTIQNKINALKNFSNLHVVTLSKWIQQQSIHSSILGKFQHHYIPNGIDTNFFKPYDKNEARVKLDLPQEKKIILFVAEHLEDKRKGLTYLHEALSLINQENVMLLTIGNGSITTNHKVKNLGFISDINKLPLIYAAADVYVIPSIEDNLPNTVLESIACGTPVVGFNIGGIPDMITDNINGLLANNKNSIDLKNNILKIINDNTLQEKMKKQARDIAEKKFSQTLQAKRHINLYNMILNNQQPV